MSNSAQNPISTIGWDCSQILRNRGRISYSQLPKMLHAAHQYDAAPKKYAELARWRKLSPLHHEKKEHNNKTKTLPRNR